MRIKKKYVEDYSSFNLVCPSLLHTKKKLKECNNTLLKHSKKYLAVTASLMMTVSSFGAMPVFATDDYDYGDDTSEGATASVEATTAGDTSLVSEKPEAVQCTSDQLSYTDESALTEGQGTLICSQSNGVYALVSGNENPTSYHWVAWYKNKSDDEPDITESDGNYKGFAQNKVDAWSQYSDEIKELNGDSFPESRDYTYPTDTEKGQIDFWADTSGYYTVLGDPKYDNLEVTAYENVSYAKEEVTVSDTILSKAGSDSPFTTDSDGNLMVDGNSPAVDKDLTSMDCETFAQMAGVNMTLKEAANICKQIEKSGKTKDGKKSEGKRKPKLSEVWGTYQECKGKDTDCQVMKRRHKVTGDDGIERRITEAHDTNGMTSFVIEKKNEKGKWVKDAKAMYHAVQLAVGPASTSRYDKSKGKIIFREASRDYKAGDKTGASVSIFTGTYGAGRGLGSNDILWNYGKKKAEVYLSPDSRHSKESCEKAGMKYDKQQKTCVYTKSFKHEYDTVDKYNSEHSTPGGTTNKRSLAINEKSKLRNEILDFIKTSSSESTKGVNEIIGEPVSDTTQEYTVDSAGNNVLRETTTTVSYYNIDVTIAKATVNGSAYATELAQMPLLSLEKGSGSDFTMSISQDEDSFWKNTKPSYWGNDGKITVKNDSSTSWHFTTLQDSADDFEENFVSLYAQLPHTDKVLPFAHPYNNVQYIDKLTNQDYPDGIEETCFSISTGNGKTRQVCAKPQTPLMKVHLDVDGDTPQVDVDDEVEKKVTLSKDKDGKDSSKDNDSSTSNNNSNPSNNNNNNNKTDTSLPKVDDCAQTPWNHGVCDD